MILPARLPSGLILRQCDHRAGATARLRGLVKQRGLGHGNVKASSSEIVLVISPYAECQHQLSNQKAPSLQSGSASFTSVLGVRTNLARADLPTR